MIVFDLPDRRLEGRMLSKSTSSRRPGVEVLRGMSSVSLSLWFASGASCLTWTAGTVSSGIRIFNLSIYVD